MFKAIPHAIAMIRAADNKSPREAVEFVLQLLKYNDNNGNPFSDVYWLAALVQSIGELEFGQQSMHFLSSLLKCIDRLLQFDRLMPSYNGILTISCIRTLTQIALKLSSSVPLDRVIELIKPFCNFKTLWEVRIEARRALLDLEFHCGGIDAALLLFIKYLEEETSLRGEVKLAVHAMRLCHVRSSSEFQDEIKTSTLVSLLRMLDSHKAFNNVFLRHNLFCILQILAGRPPTLYGVSRTQIRTSGDAEIYSDLTIKPASSMKVKLPQPEQVMDPQNLKLAALPIPEPPKEPDTVSNGSERRMPLVKIRVKASAASSRATEGDNMQQILSQGIQDEAERGATSSMSVDAPPRVTNPCDQNLEEVNSFHDHDSRITASTGSAKLGKTEGNIMNELQCTADSRKSLDLPLPDSSSSPRIAEVNNAELDGQKHVSRQALSGSKHDHDGPSLSMAEATITPEKEKKDKKKKKKDKDKKRKREEGEDHKSHRDRDDPEYLERKRLKKEKKQREKEMAKFQSGDTIVPPPQTTKEEKSVKPLLQLQDVKSSSLELRPAMKEEARVKLDPSSSKQEATVKSASVEVKPNESVGSKVVIKTFEPKGDGSVHKLRIKIKNRTPNKS